MTDQPDFLATPGDSIIDPSVLPDESGVWSSADDFLEFKQRWLPGAFGERSTIRGVFGFVVLEESWETIDGVVHRTIRKAEVKSYGIYATAEK